MMPSICLSLKKLHKVDRNLQLQSWRIRRLDMAFMHIQMSCLSAYAAYVCTCIQMYLSVLVLELTMFCLSRSDNHCKGDRSHYTVESAYNG